jgi:hypothetical protein
MKIKEYIDKEIKRRIDEAFTSEQEELQSQIIKFIIDNPYPKDKKIHKFAEDIDKDHSKIEEEIYAILSDILTNGKSKGIEPKSMDKDEYKMGLKVEAEHTSIPELQRKIVFDHLTEDSKYYSKGKKLGFFDELKNDKKEDKDKNED